LYTLPHVRTTSCDSIRVNRENPDSRKRAWDHSRARRTRVVRAQGLVRRPCCCNDECERRSIVFYFAPLHREALNRAACSAPCRYPLRLTLLQTSEARKGRLLLNGQASRSHVLHTNFIQKVGLKVLRNKHTAAGDILKSVNGSSLRGQSEQSVAAVVAGPIHTQAVVVVSRQVVCERGGRRRGKGQGQGQGHGQGLAFTRERTYAHCKD